MRIAAVADLHGHLPDVPACDVLVVAGDVTPTSSHDPDFQARWLDTDFRAWLGRVPARHVVGIAGNHDFVFERAPQAVPADLPWTYLQDDAATIDGVTFWGSPWTPWFHDWAFNAPQGDADEAFLAARYAAIPAGTDVLVVHGPPAGFGDATASGLRVGSAALLDAIDRLQPAVCVFGHIHEDRGAWTRGATRLANVSAVDLQYRLTGEPVRTFDLPAR